MVAGGMLVMGSESKVVKEGSVFVADDFSVRSTEGCTQDSREDSSFLLCVEGVR